MTEHQDTTVDAPGAPATTDGPGSGGEDDLTDGRRLRAVRNRELVIDAILDLFDEGVLEFDAATLAERAGVSVRSVYRYFEDRDSLVLEGVARHGERITELLQFEIDPCTDLADRVDQFLAYRLDVYPRVETVVRVARHHASRLPVVSDTLDARRAMARTQLTQIFEPELARVRGRRLRELVAALDVATDFDSWRLLRDAHDLDDAAIHRVMADLVHRLLGPVVA